jgi:endonuclease YncB( thermonuclease family)
MDSGNTASPGLWLILAGVVWLDLAAPAHADIVGVASVIDGDTLDIHGRRVRLHGIDAPESGQSCLSAAERKWRCGQCSGPQF